MLDASIVPVCHRYTTNEWFESAPTAHSNAPSRENVHDTTAFFRKPCKIASGFFTSSLLHTMTRGLRPTSPVAKMDPVGCRAKHTISSACPVVASAVGTSTRNFCVFDSRSYTTPSAAAWYTTSPFAV